MTPFMAAPAYRGDDAAAHEVRVLRLLLKLGQPLPNTLAEAAYGVRLAAVASGEGRAERTARGLS